MSGTEQAMQVTPDTVNAIAHWCGGRAVEEMDPFDGDKRYAGVNVPTANGVQRAQQGEYVVKLDGVFRIVGRYEFERGD